MIGAHVEKKLRSLRGDNMSGGERLFPSENTLSKQGLAECVRGEILRGFENDESTVDITTADYYVEEDSWQEG